MLTVRATLKNGQIQFAPLFTPPSDAVEVLVTFVEDSPQEKLASEPAGKISERFHWKESRERITDLGGPSASEICTDDRDNDWR